MKLIILSITSYKEKDAIIEAIGQDGVYSLTAKGILDPKSKLVGLNNALTIADIETSSGKYKYPLIKNCQIIESPLKINSDYYYIGSLMLLAESTKKLLQEDEKARMYKHLYAAIINLKSAKEPWMIDIVYLANILKESGYEFEVNGCVFCGKKKNIKAFSFADGGFVCDDCLDDKIERLFNAEQMLLLREAFLSRDYAHISPYCNKENALIILRRFNQFVIDSFGIVLTSIQFLDK